MSSQDESKVHLSSDIGLRPSLEFNSHLRELHDTEETLDWIF